MSINNLKVELDPRLDKDENIFYIGRLESPVLIDLSKGATFLVFLSEDGAEELQIAVNDRENTAFSRFSRRDDRLKIHLENRSDKHKNQFFVAKVHADLMVNCFSETAFIVFVSKEGHEELQIVGDITERPQTLKNEIEVTFK